MKILMSKEACIKAQKYTNDTFLKLIDNTKKLDKEVEAQLLTIDDKPTTKKYDEMRMEIASLLKQLENNFSDINNYCDSVIKRIDEYNSH